MPSRTWLRNKTIIRRFWSHVDVRGKNDCWEVKNRKPGNYTSFTIGYASIHFHRFALMIALGRSLRTSEWSLHSCDNKLCCNPNHLFLGTAKDNSEDMLSKGRHKAQRGEEHHGAKLTEKKVLLVRKLWLSGLWNKIELAQEFEVSESAIRFVLLGKRWSHV